MSQDIKVVLTLKEGGGFLGVQAPDCDPVFTPFQGEWEPFLERIPELVREARQRWAQNPRYPKCEAPLPAQPEAPVRTAQPASRRRQQSGAQQSLF